MVSITISDTDGCTVPIILEIAKQENLDYDELPPLYNSIDTNALEKLVESGKDTVTIKFSYFDYHIKVHGGREVEIQPEDEV